MWLTGIVMSSLGGALANRSLLPHWAQRICPILPTYWAMRGLRDIILNGQGIGAAVERMLVLLGFTALFLGGAALRFRFDDGKRYFA